MKIISAALGLTLGFIIFWCATYTPPAEAALNVVQFPSAAAVSARAVGQAAANVTPAGAVINTIAIAYILYQALKTDISLGIPSDPPPPPPSPGGQYQETLRNTIWPTALSAAREYVSIHNISAPGSTDTYNSHSCPSLVTGTLCTVTYTRLNNTSGNSTTYTATQALRITGGTCPTGYFKSSDGATCTPGPNAEEQPDGKCHITRGPSGFTFRQSDPDCADTTYLQVRPDRVSSNSSDQQVTTRINGDGTTTTRIDDQASATDRIIETSAPDANGESTITQNRTEADKTPDTITDPGAIPDPIDFPDDYAREGTQASVLAELGQLYGIQQNVNVNLQDIEAAAQASNSTLQVIDTTAAGIKTAIEAQTSAQSDIVPTLDELSSTLSQILPQGQAQIEVQGRIEAELNAQTEIQTQIKTEAQAQTELQTQIEGAIEALNDPLGQIKEAIEAQTNPGGGPAPTIQFPSDYSREPTLAAIRDKLNEEHTFSEATAPGQHQCTGDAIQCAIAKAQTTTRQNLEPTANAPTLEQISTDIRDDMTLDEALAENSEEFDISSILDIGTSSGQCPADPSVEVFGATVKLPLHYLCTLATIFGAMVMVIAGMTSTKIILGSF